MAQELWNPMLGMGTASRNKFGQSLVALNNEWLGFINRRLERDVELVQRLAVSKGADDVWQAYAEFWTRAAEDYRTAFTEFTRLGTMAVDAGDFSTPENLEKTVQTGRQPQRTSRAA